MNQSTPIDPVFLESLLQVDRWSRQWLVTLEHDQAATFLAAADCYNEFTAEGLGELLAAVDRIIPRLDYGPTNPNTGRRAYRLEVGNENSRVLYVTVPTKCGLPAGTDAIVLAERLQVAAASANADEFWDTESQDFLRYRIWWD